MSQLKTKNKIKPTKIPAVYPPLKTLANKMTLEKALNISEDEAPHASSGNPGHKVGAKMEKSQAVVGGRWATLNEGTGSQWQLEDHGWQGTEA